VRHIFTKHNGSLGEVGCVGWMFARKGFITVNKDKIDEDQMMEKALEAGALDFQTTVDKYEIFTEYTDLELVRSTLEKAGIPISTAELTMLPQTTVNLDEKHADQMLKLYEALEEHDDIQKVFANFDIDESIMEKFSES
jgi:transcriptional/translational regulatory protein YebC/TACO1